MLFKKKVASATESIDLDLEFEEIYRKYWELVYSICYNNTDKIELAQGMTQDIFLSLWERKDTLQIRHLKNYLVRAAKLKVFGYYRQEAIKQKNLDLALRDYCDASNCTEDDVAMSLLTQELELFVDQLPRQCRKVFKMSREKGLTNKKIASKLKITERSVEYHISKAIKFLEKNLSSRKLA